MAFFTNFGYFNQSSSGAPSLTTTNGSFNALFHYALTTISNWTRTQHDATNFRDVWQPAAGGATPVLICKHNSADSGDARLAVVRMAESASSTTAFTDPFPTVTQAADTLANWMISTAASTTRDYHCVVWETGILLFVRTTGTTDVWEVYFAGKAFTRFSSTDDPYPWMCWVRGAATFGASNILTQTTNPIPTTPNGRSYAMRNPQGTIKSEQGTIDYPATSGLGNMGSTVPAAGGGYLGTIDRQKVLVHTDGSSTLSVGSTTIVRRFAIPQLYVPLHGGYTGIGEADTINDGSHTLLLLRASGSTALILETSNLFTGYPAG